MTISTEYEYHDWITYASGSATRLERLRLHIQEVSALISSGNFAMSGTSNDYDYLQKYLQNLMDREEKELANYNNSLRRSSFVRGKPKL